MSTSVKALYQMTATTMQFVPTLKDPLYADASMVILEMAQIAQVNNDNNDGTVMKWKGSLEKFSFFTFRTRALVEFLGERKGNVLGIK